MKRFYTILKAMESLGFSYTGEDVLITKNKKNGRDFTAAKSTII
jgi:hypothetical protein